MHICKYKEYSNKEPGRNRQTFTLGNLVKQSDIRKALIGPFLSPGSEVQCLDFSMSKISNFCSPYFG